MFIDAGDFVEKKPPEPAEGEMERQESMEKPRYRDPVPGPSPLERKKRLDDLYLWSSQLRREIETIESILSRLVDQRRAMLDEMGELESQDNR